jgi:DNA-binding NarL/FixJ family response regulator
MSGCARLCPAPATNGARAQVANGNKPQTSETKNSHAERNGQNSSKEKKTCVFLATENRLLREALARMLTRRGGLEVVGLEDRILTEPQHWNRMEAYEDGLFLFSSLGAVQQDLVVIRGVRSNAPEMRIILMGASGGEMEFLQCVRAGISGYLLQEASAEDVLAGVKAVFAGEAVCPGMYCAALFRYLEREASNFPSAAMLRELGLTRREQQLVPFIAKGLTNKEIANHFCLSEQTVKNHLYRMKRKVGAENRFGIIHLCQEQGFLA